MGTLDSNSLIKKPHVTGKFTRSQLQELAKCADPVNGPHYFMENFFHIQHPTKGGMLYKPFTYQTRLIDAYHSNRFSISMLPRQTGKSTTAAGYLLWYAMFVPDSTILVAAHKYAGSQEIMQRVRYAYESVPNHIRAGVTSYNKGSIDFDNGSRIVSTATTENTGRGMSITLLYLDEFAFVRPTIAKEFWTAISPTLATGGKAIITSTPNSDEDQFATIWKQANKCTDEFGNETPLGINGFKALSAHWSEHPDRDEKWAEDMQAQLGEERFRREIGCEFIINDETLINSLTLIEMSGIDPLEKHGQIRWYKKPIKGKMYAVALDPSLGTGGDYAAIQILELPSLMQVGEWQHNKTRIQEQVKLLQTITNYIYECTGVDTDIYYSVENNTLGEAALVAINELGEENIRGTFISESARTGGKRLRKGFTTTNRSKIAVCAKFKQLVESGKFKLASKNLLSELKNFVAHGGSYAAKPGETDDLVMSMLLAIRISQSLQNYDQSLDNAMRGDDSFIAPMPFVMF
mgnify:FL=1|tara:strand:+ start:1743 stop:3302 length:1560 start_codon:yes stop_codon:yes gene_type:complete